MNFLIQIWKNLPNQPGHTCPTSETVEIVDIRHSNKSAQKGKKKFSPKKSQTN